MNKCLTICYSSTRYRILKKNTLHVAQKYSTNVAIVSGYVHLCVSMYLYSHFIDIKYVIDMVNVLCNWWFGLTNSNSKQFAATDISLRAQTT